MSKKKILPDPNSPYVNHKKPKTAWKKWHKITLGILICFIVLLIISPGKSKKTAQTESTITETTNSITTVESTTVESTTLATTAKVTETTKPPLDYEIEGSNISASPGQNTSFTITGKPGVSYDISVYYPGGSRSEAAGLIEQTADDSGQVTWQWKIGNKTSKGTASISVWGSDGSRAKFDLYIE